MIDRKAPEEGLAKALEALHDIGTQYAKDHDIQLMGMPPSTGSSKLAGYTCE